MSTWGTTEGRDAIAVIGMACRFPGADSVEQLWPLLRDGVDATGDTPVDRYDAKAMHSSLPKRGKVTSLRSGYLSRIDHFDADFFGLSAHEADALDPQQRLLLMSTWEALEDAGLPPSTVAGTRTGVYVGAQHVNYWELQARQGLDAITPAAIYNHLSVLSGRLSYTFDLRGPSISLDTACSSSLVAVHLACQSLRAGETTLALAAGVNLKLIPDTDVLISQLRMFAPDGRCKFGDASADGFAPSDGVGVVVLKRLADALAAGDRVRGVILGSAVTNDGASSGALLTPSVEGHTQMLRWAYENAGVAPSDVDFVEAHGTGTPMIDPIEFAGLGEVLGEHRPADHPLYVGSIKSNVGHTQGAAGVAALIKTLLCLEHREVVPSLHFTTPNPKVAWDSSPLCVPTEVHPIADRGRLAVAGISGQGISSVNTHLVVGEADPAWREHTAADADPYLLVLSARHQNALDDLVRRYVDHLDHGTPLRDLCFSAATRRDHHGFRLAVTASSVNDLRDALHRHLNGSVPPLDPRFAAAAEEYLNGGVPDWRDLFPASARWVPLPRYPWQTRAYWLEAGSD